MTAALKTQANAMKDVASAAAAIKAGNAFSTAKKPG